MINPMEKKEKIYTEKLILARENNFSELIENFIEIKKTYADINNSEGYRLGYISALLELKEEIENAY